MSTMPTPTSPICGKCGAPADAPMCRPCTTTYVTDCLRVPGVLVQLRITLVRGDVHTSEPSRPAGGPAPLPYNEAASHLIDDLERLLRRREQRAPAGPNRVARTATTRIALEHIARRRAQRADLFRRRPEAPTLARDLHHLLDHAHRVIDRKATVWDFGPCTCGRTLHGDPDATTLTCPGCNTSHDAVKLKERQWTAAADALVTQAEAAQWLTIRHDLDPRGVDRLRSRINLWVHRDRVPGRPGVIDGREQTLVRFGDVLDQYRKAQAMNHAKATRNRQADNALRSA